MSKPTAPRKIIEKPSVLVLYEKHGELYFHVPDDETLFRYALDILTKRRDAGYWYLDPEENKPTVKDPGMTKEQAEALPEGPIRTAALKEIAHYRSAQNEYKQLKEAWDEIRKAIDSKDGQLAWRVLKDHSDGEYERISIERYEDTYYDS